MDGSHEGSVRMDEALDLMRSVQELVVDGPRAALISREGYHRPHTRGGGYNRVSHNKLLTDIETQDPRRGTSCQPRHKLSTKAVVETKASFGGDIKNASLRNGKTWNGAGEVPLQATKKGMVLTDWPYNRGSTPPAFHPLPLYTPVDTRDENGKIKEADGRVFGRNYFSNHSRSMVTAGGYLNGLPRAGNGYRPDRVCGKGVVEEVKAREQEAALKALEMQVGDDANAQIFLETLRKSKVKTVPIEDQIAARIVNLHGGGDWGLPLEFLPIQLVKGSDLLELDLSSNKLRRIVDSICNMPNLTRMNLDSNSLEALPQGLDALKSLIWFSCCNNLIDRLPLSFARLPSIQMADFSNNKIELVPEHLASVSSLITLSIVGNKVNSQMPAFPGAEEQNVLKMASLHQMACLTSLNLECNKLTHVPMGLSVLSNLQYLRLGRNQIESHGKGGTSHPALEAADAMIQLKHLAPNLLFLELNQNRIDWIPKDLCQLSRLTHLDLSMNQVSSIPDEVSSLVALRTFKIDRNPLLSIPSSIASMSWLREFSSKDSVLGRVGGVVDAVPGGTVGRWRRQHGPIDGKIFQQLGKYLQLDPIVLANYEKARNYVEFDSHAGASGAVTQSISPLKSAGPKSGSPGTPGSRHGSRHGSRRGARSALATTHGWDEFIDAESTAAQHARGRQELIEAKARYIQRKNDKFANYGQKVAKSPGAFSMTILSPPTSPLKVLSTARGISGFASIATGILEKTEGSMSPASPTMRTGTFQSTRPHVRTYLFEHQLENSQFELEDGRKGKKEECWQPAVGKRNGTGRTSRGASRGGVGRAASAASAQSDNSDVSNDSNPAVVAHKMREKEIVRFNAQMGIVKDVEAQKAFEYYRNTATTPYLQIERLQGL